MDWKLEVVVVPVADVDRAKAFYAERLGFNVDVDRQVTDAFRVVQLTPPGSACSITLLSGGGAQMEPGSLQGLQLVVPDVRAAHAQLVERGVEAGEVQVFEAGGPRPAREDDALDYAGFVFFKDPDGNGWAVQQISPAARPAG
jgi:catechol 2,3-dioxygenase-like lactoylglutathione lyase family enzyme